MKHTHRHTKLILLVATILITSSCASHRVNMRKHKRNRHCNCPTFTHSERNAIDDSTLVLSFEL